MSKRIEDLTAAGTIELANTLLEIQQLNLTAGTQSRKLQLDDLRDAIRPINTVRSVSSNYTITGRDDDRIVQVTTGATDRTITLPAGSGMIPGDEIEVDKDDSGTGKVILAAAGADTIDGVASVDIDSQYDLARVRWTGSRWRLVEYKDHGEGNSSSTSGESWQVTYSRFVDGRMEADIWWSVNGDGASSSVGETMGLGITFAELYSITTATIGATAASSSAWSDIYGSSQNVADVIIDCYPNNAGDQIFVEMYRPSGSSFSASAIYGGSVKLSGRWRA
jgi:hypothetical protein